MNKTWIVNNGDFYVEYINNTIELSHKTFVYNYQNQKYVFHDIENTYLNNLDNGYILTNSVDTTSVHINQDLIVSWDDYESAINKTELITDTTYNSVRLNFRSNYTFDTGLFLNMYLYTTNTQKVNLANVVLLDTLTPNIHITPLLIGEYSYSYYVDILIPNIDNLKNDSNLSLTNTLGNILIDNEDSINSNNFQFDLGEIHNKIFITTDLGNNLSEDYTFFKQIMLDKIHVDTTNVDTGINAFIDEVNDYFVLQPQKVDESISSYINNLSSMLNTTFLLLHNIELYVQFDDVYMLVDNLSSIKSNDFDTAIHYRPIIKNSYNAVSFKIKYSLKIFNNTTNISETYISEYVSHTPHKYGSNMTRLNIVNPTIHKVYNKQIKNVINYNITDNLLPQIKYETKYYNTSLITVNDKIQNELIIVINDIDTQIKFIINEDDINLNLGNNTYHLIFVKDDGTFIKIINKFDDDINSQHGELLFNITSDIIKQILTSSNNNFYIAYSNINTSVLYTGNWVSSQQKNEEVIIANNIKLHKENIELNKKLLDLKNEFNDYKLANANKQVLKKNIGEYDKPINFLSKGVIGLKKINKK